MVMAQQPVRNAGVSSIWMLERGARSNASMDATAPSIASIGSNLPTILLDLCTFLYIVNNRYVYVVDLKTFGVLRPGQA